MSPEFTLRRPVWGVYVSDVLLGNVVASDRDDARHAAADRYGGDAARYAVRYVSTVIEPVTAAADATAA